jgi:hypothetical protein
MPPDRASLSIGVGCALVCAGCGGGAALMHPAHPLPPNTISMGAGVSGNFLVGSAGGDIDRAIAANSDPGVGVSPEQEEDYLTGAFAQSLLAPGLAPWVGARAGLGLDAEAGLTYTGRLARVDARRAFVWDDVALSLGLGASGRLIGAGSDGPYEEVIDEDTGETQLVGPVGSSGEIASFDDRGVTGWGVDVPVIVGWTSTANLIQVYGGPRGGYEMLFGEYAWQLGASDPQKTQMDGSRWYVGALFGIIASVHPLWAGVELGVAHHWAEGSVEIEDAVGTPIDTFSADLTGVTLTPTGVLGSKF